MTDRPVILPPLRVKAMRTGVCEMCGAETRTNSARGSVPKKCRPCGKKRANAAKRLPDWEVTRRTEWDQDMAIRVEFSAGDGSFIVVSAAPGSHNARALAKLKVGDVLTGKKWRVKA